MTEDSARREFQIKEKEEIHRNSGFLCTSGLSEREVHVCVSMLSQGQGLRVWQTRPTLKIPAIHRRTHT